jgi:site-specific DNA-methyltransferase (adenine-specific)
MSQPSPSFEIWNSCCIEGSKTYLNDNSFDLLICDPPFGINESSFDNKHYARKENVILSGYVEAPKDYHSFSLSWISEAKRILKEGGTLYIISGWTNLHDILNVINLLNFSLINHIIWKYNFGVYTKNKWVSSHYHILMVSKNPSKITFNTSCRFGDNDKSNRYKDMEDVFIINKEYQKNTTKNKNKLPNELVKKLILYSSNKGDLVGDFFMGNFTTAYQALETERRVSGFELNKESFDFHFQRLVEFKKSEITSFFD